MALLAMPTLLPIQAACTRGGLVGIAVLPTFSSVDMSKRSDFQDILAPIKFIQNVIWPGYYQFDSEEQATRYGAVTITALSC